MKLKATLLVATLLWSCFQSFAQGTIDTVNSKYLYGNWFFTKDVSVIDGTCVLLIESFDRVVFRDTVDYINRNRVSVDWAGNGFVSIVYTCGTYCW